MSLPRMRFTVRRLMGVTAAVAVCLAAWMAWSRLEDPTLEYYRRAMRHAALAQAFATGSCDRPSILAVVDPRKAAHHAALARKYGRAARYPFLPVWPDPPEPE